MSEADLKKLEQEVISEIAKAKDAAKLEELFKKYLGKQGELILVLRSLKGRTEGERKVLGKMANEVKVKITKVLEERKKIIVKTNRCLAEESFDVTVPGKRVSLGHLHPLTLGRRKVEEIFQELGFSVMEGPEIENAWYNFDALNIPAEHPARDLWDTFWLKNGLLLRTHTSPVQIRCMEKTKPPLRVIVPGTVYRHEATDASHEFQLFQIEGLMVDKELSVANLKAIMEEFFSRFFAQKIKARINPDYFPFTEPSFDIGINCLVCGGKGCATCKKTGWLEVGGAGMVHPEVFKNSGLNPKDWQGWAFGFGLDRLVMLKHKIGDVRLFRSNDFRFLKQF